MNQHEPITEYISCPVCYKVFNDSTQRPISLSCGHTVCKACLQGRMGNERRCPYDQKPFPADAETLPANYALMQVLEVTSNKDSHVDELPGQDYSTCYGIARQCIQDISFHLKPLAENSSDDEGSPSTPQQLLASDKAQNTNRCYLSRPLQRKVISLIQCQILEDEGRSRAARIARSIGERVMSELLASQQFPHQLSANLWVAVRARGCQFLGPAMQEEALKLILLTLENGSMLSRKVLVLYVVGKLSSTYPHASKTAIGHVVQLLYRASCFTVNKRDEDSSLMQLKEEFREYDALRREHDAQIVQIAMEAGLRIPPEQWSSLLYGDLSHKSHMQSIMDKLQNPQSFSQCILELVQVLQRNGDSGGFLKLRHRFEFLSCIDPSPEAEVPSMQDMKAIMQSLNMVMKEFVNYISHPTPRVAGDSQTVPNPRYKTSMCRDIASKGVCPRGTTCTFAHTQDELERHRMRSRRSMNKLGLMKDDNCEGDDVGKAGCEPEMQSSDACISVQSVVAKPLIDSDEKTPGICQDVYGNRSNNNAANLGLSCLSEKNSPLHDAINPSSSPSATTHTASPIDNSNCIVASSSPIPPPLPGFPETLLTFSQPGREAPSIPYLPHIGLQTSFHPHNMRGPPPHLPPSVPPIVGIPESYPSNVLSPSSSCHKYFSGYPGNSTTCQGRFVSQQTPTAHPTPPHLHPHQHSSANASFHNSPLYNVGHTESITPVSVNNGGHIKTHQDKSHTAAIQSTSVHHSHTVSEQCFLSPENDTHVKMASFNPRVPVAEFNNLRISTDSYGGPDGAFLSLNHGTTRILSLPETPALPAVHVDDSLQKTIILPAPFGITGPPPLPNAVPAPFPPLPHHTVPVPCPSPTLVQYIPLSPYQSQPHHHHTNFVMWAPDVSVPVPATAVIVDPSVVTVVQEETPQCLAEADH